MQSHCTTFDEKRKHWKLLAGQSNKVATIYHRAKYILQGNGQWIKLEIK